MVWLIGILKFMAAAVAVFFTCAFILSCIQSVVNPNIVEKDGKVSEANDNTRSVFALIMSISWALVIAL